MRSVLNVWYLDNGTLGGTVEDVSRDLVHLKERLLGIGLEINPSKCEVVFLNQAHNPQSEIFSSLQSILPGATITLPDQLTLLGSPIFPEGLPSSLQSAKSLITKLC